MWRYPSRLKMRTYEILTADDFKEMRNYALEELERFFQISHSKYQVYQNKLIAICLGQGAAKHYIDKKTGIEDIDIWFFFEEDDNVKIPHRRNMRKQTRKPFTKLGTKPIDFLKKMIPRNCIVKGNKPGTLQDYLTKCKTQTASKLSEKPIIGLHPDELFGKVLWPSNVR